MKKILLLLFVAFSINGFAQETETKIDLTLAEELIEKESKLTIGGYGQIDYNQNLEKGIKQSGELDVHRLVMLFAYKFNSKTSFVTEIEYEHVSEVYIEQAFINHKFNDLLNFRAGLMLIPMGIINQYHEPTLFNGVERPSVDNVIIPSTWREIGLGLTGRSNELSLKYELYVVNGFLGYNGAAKFTGASPFRSGRQKGAESIINSPNLTSRVEYYGVNGVKLGLSGYFGKSQSTLFDGGIDEDDTNLMANADSSIVGISMLGADIRYNKMGIELKAQYTYAAISNTEQYNEFAASNLASAVSGYYLEAGYDVFSSMDKEMELVPFVRYENYNTHAKVEAPLIANESYHKEVYTLGLGLKLAKGAVLKADYQFAKSKTDTEWANIINLGVGVSF